MYISHRALRAPIASGSLLDTPPPPIPPGWPSPNRAAEEATIRSQASASSIPPMRAVPFTAAMIGLGTAPKRR